MFKLQDPFGLPDSNQTMLKNGQGENNGLFAHFIPVTSGGFSDPTELAKLIARRALA